MGSLFASFSSSTPALPGAPTGDGRTDMTTLLGSNLDATPRPSAPDGGERSIREALRITTLFLAVVILLLWAGLADASAITDSSVRAAGPDVPSSSPTLR